jgi:hypothetical protein
MRLLTTRDVVKVRQRTGGIAEVGVGSRVSDVGVGAGVLGWGESVGAVGGCGAVYAHTRNKNGNINQSERT